MVELAKEMIQRWQRDEITLLAAALAFFTVLTLAPLLVVVIAVLDFLGQGGAQTVVLDLVRRLLGANGADLVRNMISIRQAASDSWIATVGGGALLLVGATGLFSQLQHALNLIWRVRPSPQRGLWLTVLRMRVVSLGMVLVIGFLLLVSLVLTAAIEALAVGASSALPGLDALWVALDVGVSVLMVLGLFTLIFRTLPDARVPVWAAAAGATFTALLFTVGEWGLGLYLVQRAGEGEVSAAGSLIVLLLWVFYSAHIVLLGAVLSKVALRLRGGEIEPADHAVLREDWP